MADKSDNLRARHPAEFRKRIILEVLAGTDITELCRKNKLQRSQVMAWVGEHQLANRSVVDLTGPKTPGKIPDDLALQIGRWYLANH